VSLNRLEEFLLAPELDPSSVQKEDTGDGPVISIKHAAFQWSLKQEPSLKDINLEVLFSLEMQKKKKCSPTSGASRPVDWYHWSCGIRKNITAECHCGRNAKD
jgi:hypothetical protein